MVRPNARELPAVYAKGSHPDDVVLLAAWLLNFCKEGGRISWTCNNLSILASNKLGHHHFSLCGRPETDINYIIDIVFPYL